MNLRIDLSEVGSQPYYTGAVFQAYMEKADSAVAGGGRYNDMLKLFGFDCPSVGFSLLLSKIEPFIGSSGKFSLPKKMLKAEGSTFEQRFSFAEEKRKKGGIVCL